MPYKLDCSDDEHCYVINSETGEKKNKEPMPRSRAQRYMNKLYSVMGVKEADKLRKKK